MRKYEDGMYEIIEKTLVDKNFHRYMIIMVSIIIVLATIFYLDHEKREKKQNDYDYTVVDSVEIKGKIVIIDVRYGKQSKLVGVLVDSLDNRYYVSTESEPYTKHKHYIGDIIYDKSVMKYKHRNKTESFSHFKVD